MGAIKPDPGGFPIRKVSEVPLVSAETMRGIQRAAIEEFDMDILQLMENAGRAAARLALGMLGGKARGQRIVVLAGGGNNGAAGLCAARNLANWGFLVEPIYGTIEEDMSMPTRRQARILRTSGVQEHHDRPSSEETLQDHLVRADLVIDALVGYGLQGPPVGIAAAATEMAVASRRPILSLDVPTGVDATTGAVSSLAIRATTTLALDLPKQGVCLNGCREYVGALFLADLGVPRKVYDRFDLDVNGVFSEGPMVRIRR
jgi:NAD(P)H-hydrate epimerase